ncbi:metal-dependent transcriptional regulator [Sedimentibacter sp. MB31-C6]|uniref:metal-dependent transcriptional regulator n=1 Tax=Sedimentibacter sp. MB31-C6 TaxID=3109366 RepID=UPI002DDCDB9D|nr:metal-dependent transcriptional regulator [Sedimentibacter sp. MB36-C1]WSI03462.1 metal-dependent transcriptional regulator [Sedimentibacter sp. MB36-C1]
MSNNESMEMYLETVYILENNHGHAHVVDIANRLAVSKPGVTKAIKHLKEQGFVNTQKYGVILLTEKGREVSEEIYKKHQLIELFLEHSLKLSAEQASIDACKIEHVLSDEMTEAIKIYLKRNNIDIEKL